MRTMRNVRNFALVSIALLGMFVFAAAVHAQEHMPTTTAQVTQSAKDAGDVMVMSDGRGIAFLAVAITMGMACLAAGIAVGKVGAAAMGAAAEKPEILTKAIVFAGLGEGIAIFGLIISLLILNKL